MDKAIFITGAGSGIGRATALHFAHAGWRVGLADVNEAGLAGTAERLPDGRSLAVPLDVGDRRAWDEGLARFATWSGGRLDVLHNNAGIARGGQFATLSDGDLEALIDVNFRGVVYGARAGFALLNATPGSCLLNTCSASGIYGSPGLSLYSATKFGVRGLTEALELEWAPHGIKVRSLMPGFIDTAILDLVPPDSNRSAREAVREAGLEFTPVERVAQAAWDAVHGRSTHTLVGPTAHRLARAARWMPGMLKRQLGSGLLGRETTTPA